MNSQYQGKYSIVMGWVGRSYLYKHLVDEFWEIDEQHQWLRDYCRAFHHASLNLKRVEREAAKLGKVIDVHAYGMLCLQPKVTSCACGGTYDELGEHQVCNRCSKYIAPVGLYHRIAETKKKAVWTPPPSPDKINSIKKYIKNNSVGITARSRTCYGRNLPAEFYVKLIELLESIGYNPVWIGEKETTIPCPVSHVVDFSRTEDAYDLEKTLALVSQLRFTIQFWTASTRLAGLVGTPYILFESPDQIYGAGQEGYRMNLCTKGEKKLVLAHYLSVMENPRLALDTVRQAVLEVEEGNYSDMIGLVENKEYTSIVQKGNQKRIGSK
jgi:hypothetical protein